MSQYRKHFIVLGAGASFDFIDREYLNAQKRAAWDHTYRPPLASELFNPARFSEVLDKYDGVKDLSGSVLSELRRGKDLEEYLLELRNIEHRVPQLIQLVFYLGDLFARISDQYGGAAGNNYSALVQSIRDHGGQASVVTFNYDSLLESELRAELPKDKHTLNDYIKHGIQVIKMHGSCEWSYVSGPYYKSDIHYIDEVGGLMNFLAKQPNAVYGIGLESAARSNKPELIPKRDFKHRSSINSSEDSTYLSYPALAIPLRTKHTNICPNEHISALKSALISAQKILIIGWKAADENLLNIFSEIVKHPVEFTIVQGKGSESVQKTQEKIKSKCPAATFKIVDEGFTGFMASRAKDEFFS